MRFDNEVKRIASERDTKSLLSLWDTQDGHMAHPIPDHWLPLIYAYAATDDRDQVAFSSEAFDLGSISMRNLMFA